MITVKPQEGLVADKKVGAAALARYIELRVLGPEEEYARRTGRTIPDLTLIVGPPSISRGDETGVEVRPYTGSEIAMQRLRFECKMKTRGMERDLARQFLSVIVKTVYAGGEIRRSREEENPHFGMSGDIMKLLQEESIRGAEKPTFPYAPFVLSSTAEMQVMERLRGRTLRELLDGGKDKESGVVTVGLNQSIEEEMKRAGLEDLNTVQHSNGRLEELLEQLVGMFKKAVERQVSFAQHLTFYQDLLPRYDDRSLRDPGKEEPGYVLRLLCGEPTEYGEQGYLPIMLTAACKRGHISQAELDALLSLDLSTTQGMRRLRRIVNQSERIRPILKGGEKIYRRKVVSHGDCETDNILVGNKNERRIPLSEDFIVSKPEEEVYFILDFGRTRVIGNKDLATLVSDPAFRYLRSSWVNERFKFDPIKTNNEVIAHVTEGIPREFVLEAMDDVGLWLPASLHNASRVAKKIRVAEKWGLYTPLDEALASTDEETLSARLRESQGIQHHLGIFLESVTQRGGVLGQYRERLTRPLQSLLQGLRVDIEKLATYKV